jgi:MoaA/NifB/PqqE/SkfB family radical SAM enzyme
MCDYCGIHGIWAKKEHRIIKPMDMDLLSLIARSLANWWQDKGKRVELAMHGEPTLHPHVIQAVSTLRNWLPKCQLQLTTNGIVARKQGVGFLRQLFGAGLNILIIDTYTHREELKHLASRAGVRVHDYYENTSFNPYHYHNEKLQGICLMQDLGKVSGQRAARTIINHAGNGNEQHLRKLGVKLLIHPLEKKCALPFREISIHYDGTISLCCLDWRHEFVVAKFPKDGELSSIWHDNKVLAIMRHLLYNKDRQVVPCRYCDYNGGFRLGLLPNFQLDMPTEECLSYVADHLRTYRKFAHPTARPVFTNFKKQQPGIRELLSNNR